MDKLATLLSELGQLVNVPLHPDQSGGCSFNIDNKITITLQGEDDKETVLICAFIGELPPPGKFREIMLEAMLKENGSPYRFSHFGYSKRKSQVALFDRLILLQLNGDSLADFIERFIQKALFWRTALETGELPQKSEKSRSK